MLCRTHNLWRALFAAAAIAVSITGLADAYGAEVQNKRTSLPIPNFTITKGDKCVEPTDVMRDQHMEFILHQRDETTLRGIRTTKHSLKNCVNCHANPETKSVVGKDGFCESCHSYAAVSIDCFSCHTDKATDKKSVRSGLGAIGSKIIAGTGGVK
ncbi:MAG: hypothetical protein V3R65_00830 [Acidiferrobacterales bacterium]